MFKKRGERNKFFPENNRGQELSTSTIILIILGIAVLVILVIGFTVGWGKVVPWLSSTNVDTIANQCQAACTTSDTYGFCSLQRKLIATDLPNDATGKVQKDVTKTCNFFSTDTNYLKYNIGACPGLCPAATTP
ncbi:Uncharacterised protein [uncultured archaeon]|nr:Uncharacterised protein [uncultured archaeon]